MKKILLLLSVCLLAAPTFAKQISLGNLQLDLVSSTQGKDSYRFQSDDNGRSDILGNLTLEIEETDQVDISLWSEMNTRDEKEDGIYKLREEIHYISTTQGQQHFYVINSYCIADPEGFFKKGFLEITRVEQMDNGFIRIYKLEYAQNLDITPDIQFERDGYTYVLPSTEFFEQVVLGCIRPLTKGLLELDLSQK